MSEYVCERLNKRHDRKRFHCGVVELDTWFREQARQDLDRNVSAVFVMTPVSEPNRVAGFYTLSAASIAITELPDALTRKLPRYPIVPAILIGRLARDLAFPRTGSLLIADALQRASSNAEEVAATVVVVDAKDDKAAEFYRRFGFENLANTPRRLFISMSVVRKQTR
jgi:hypothetical protein